MIVLQSKRLRAHVLTQGAILSGLWLAGHNHSLVLGAPEPATYSRALPYFGAVVGPVANRVGGAEVTIRCKVWQMPANEGATCLHSGPQGLHTRIWHIAEQSLRHVVLRCHLDHGAMGLPGVREITATYRITDDGVLGLTLTAISDRDTAMNLAHHPYWNLDGSPTVGGHRLQVMAETYLPVDDQTLPTGQIASVTGTSYDFRTARAVPTDLMLDACACLASARRPTLETAAILSAPPGLRLQIDTTEPGLQIYNGAGLEPAPAALHPGQRLGRCAGIALEPQGWPDALRHEGFPSILLPAGQLYEQRTEYCISD
ncbi:aldose epimerase family protein [Roseobacter weihaiensis]|uniref:aldose epimerase family protein n=1 Tax=Roseobacter weihaiensis TaxID=2763262 RepID=UPI001D0B24E1|nr:aldose epimerase family protein [Roseobacter sp. H9]